MSDLVPHILVVDDDTRLRELLQKYLVENGYRVTTARDAADARSRLNGLSFDLLILDVMMPGRDGFDVCRVLKQDERLRDIPIVLLSARGQEHDRARGMALGADAFMTKPYSPTELVAQVRVMLDEQEGQAACR